MKGKAMAPAKVPPTTVQRLPLYLRCLVQASTHHMPVVNSVQIAEMAGTNAAQVRKDLSYLGEFGTRGIGYDVDSLIAHLSRHLGLTEHRRVAIVGYGRLGSALQGYQGFAERGMRVVAVLDADPAKIGIAVDALTVEDIESLEAVVARERVEIAVITVPAAAAQSVADRLVAAGIRAIMNFAPVALRVPEGVEVRQADVAGELQILSFHLHPERTRV
ncbi:MAG: redox-sensing transcriptional repressor Rex [Anaerosomatales bacterium]|nr:redox-sensing transcriptional repressor Rex [Anaerosomatales bacterium]MDT8434832.1 redox-sensing transcriptional repressor Rex [Anaerosomatales bacterium]